MGVALRKLSDGTNLPEGEKLKINRELNGLSRCDNKNCRVVEKWREILILQFLPIMATSKILRTLKELDEATNYKRKRSSLCSKLQRIPAER